MTDYKARAELRDLSLRLELAASRLEEVMEADAVGNDRIRLRGKRDGVLLARSYVEEAIRLADLREKRARL